jgi:curli biogenesis system outer membrane secretion channel CsgG
LLPRFKRIAGSAFVVLLSILAGGSVSAASDGRSQRAETLAKDWLHAKGWQVGHDKKSQRLVFLETATISVKPTDPTYLIARDAAFTSAMGAARKSASEYLSAEISSRLESNRSIVEVVGDEALAKSLTGLAARKGTKGSSELAVATALAAEAMLVGLYTSQTFESTADSDDPDARSTVALVAVIGPGSGAAARGGSVKREGCAGTRLGEWFDSIPDDQLARAWGVRYQTDEECMLYPVSFGQARAGSEPLTMDAAIELAAQTANRQLSDLLGEAVVARTLSQSASCFERASDTPPQFRSVQAYRNAVATSSSHHSGFVRVGRRTVQDPATGERVVVVAVATVPTTSDGPSDIGAASELAPQSAGCPPVPPAMAASTRQTQAMGTAPTRAAALESALFEAIRREGANVKGNAVLERQYSEAMKSVDGQVKKLVAAHLEQSSKVETFSKGFVHSYEVVKEAQTEGLWEVTICVNLVRFDPKNPRFGLPPTVAILPFACEPSFVRVAGSAVPCAEATSPCENALGSVIAKSKSFMLLRERDQPRLRQVREDIARRVAAGSAEEIEAIKLGRELTADFILTGTVARAEFTGPSGQQPQGVQADHNASAVVEGQLVNVSTGEVVWSKSVTVSLMGRDILLVRAGRNLADPAEQALSPLQLAVSRAARQLAESLAGSIPSAPEDATARSAPLKVLRVSNGMVTLDSSNPAVTVGAKFTVYLLTDIALPGGRTEIDRDQVATIEVVTLNGGLAKARVTSGDGGAIDPAKCEVVQESK